MSTIESVPAFPLAWPATTPRTKSRKSSPFGKFDWNRVVADLHRELRLLGAKYVTLSTNLALRNDGKPYAQQRNVEDPGVAVYFTYEGEQICFPCDLFPAIADNIRAVTKHIEAMRGQQRWGVGTARQAFAGYKALPPSTEDAGEPWWVVLKCRPGDSQDYVRSLYLALAKSAHPDHAGGSAEAMQRLNKAKAEADDHFKENPSAGA